jgi:hypothetical protein
MSGNKDKVLAAIASMYDDQIPMVRFFGVKPDFKIPRTQLEIMFMPGNPATPEDSEKMMANSAVYVDMLLAAEILAIARPEKTAEVHEGPRLEEPVTMIKAGKDFDLFLKEAKEYVDTDAVIIRTLGISRQDFDMVANEYKSIVSGVANIDEILEAWADLSNDTKTGIIRGVLLQRSIMAEVLITMRGRTLPILRYEQETLAWITDLLGPENQPKEPVKE